jgi:hypothetical protein
MKRFSLFTWVSLALNAALLTVVIYLSARDKDSITKEAGAVPLSARLAADARPSGPMLASESEFAGRLQGLRQLGLSSNEAMWIIRGELEHRLQSVPIAEEEYWRSDWVPQAAASIATREQARESMRRLLLELFGADAQSAMALGDPFSTVC